MKKLDALKIELRQLESNPPKVNHILHLILSFFTGGLWLIVWALIGMSTPSMDSYTLKVIKLENKIKELEQ